MRGEDGLQRRVLDKRNGSHHVADDGRNVVKADLVFQIRCHNGLIGRIHGAGNVAAPLDGVEGQLQAGELFPVRFEEGQIL